MLNPVRGQVCPLKIGRNIGNQLTFTTHQEHWESVQTTLGILKFGPESATCEHTVFRFGRASERVIDFFRGTQHSKDGVMHQSTWDAKSTRKISRYRTT